MPLGGPQHHPVEVADGGELAVDRAVSQHTQDRFQILDPHRVHVVVKGVLAEIDQIEAALIDPVGQDAGVQGQGSRFERGQIAGSLARQYDDARKDLGERPVHRAQ